MSDIGILALQGDVREHARMIGTLGYSTREVRRPDDLEGLSGLVLPGGESTTIGRLSERFGLLGPLREVIGAGLPTLGTCAGMIFLASGVTEGEQQQLGVVDAVVHRNAFGRQNDSFEADVEVRGLVRPFHAVFIRAPWVEHLGPNVEVLADVGGHPVLIRSGNVVAGAFHPELTGDARIHEMALSGIGAG
ncbi:glutamine amidotransferase subunit PdxT [bacterium BMS3Abin02]|nr:glutamine amidotransferase subunit PdxT [bacterium BMS3Abin02]GBE21060.1 glutamine amidotransferase subunit PdxT [bacterium BMS3Bbin01]